jgi:hypothetical protein
MEEALLAVTYRCETRACNICQFRSYQTDGPRKTDSSRAGGAKMALLRKWESTRPIDSNSISISSLVPAILRRLSLCSRANSEEKYQKVHGKSYTLRNVATCPSL